MKTLKIMGLLTFPILLLAGCIPDSLDDCPLPEEPEQEQNVDITIELDTELEMGQETGAV